MVLEILPCRIWRKAEDEDSMVRMWGGCSSTAPHNAAVEQGVCKISCCESHWLLCAFYTVVVGTSWQISPETGKVHVQYIFVHPKRSQNKLVQSKVAYKDNGNPGP